jgi:hypothetical protein
MSFAASLRFKCHAVAPRDGKYASGSGKWRDQQCPLSTIVNNGTPWDALRRAGAEHE